MPMPSDQGDVAGVEVTGPGRLRTWATPRVILSAVSHSAQPFGPPSQPNDHFACSATPTPVCTSYVS